MRDAIVSTREKVDNKNFLYIVGVDMIISGCKLDFKIKDIGLLKSISDDDCAITSICFYSLKEGKSVLKCKIATKNLFKAYKFIDYKLKSTIIKTLITIKNIKDLSIEDNINCVIENIKEAKKQGVIIIQYGSKYLSLVVKIPNVEENEFEAAMRKVIENNCEFENVLFWMYNSYSLANINEGKTNFDYISQYSLLWTAFNALYSKLYPELGDRKSVEEFAAEQYVINYFEILFSSYDTYQLLKQLSLQELTLRGKKNILENVSEKLKKSLEAKDNNQIALNGMLCLYAVRNAIIHGTAVKEVELCRIAFDVLNPLIKLNIINEMGG
ncbi:hypothetical protein [Clostridium estertheticum]|nr:hypothetical protein [Clostridium estertheticum]MBU3170212.1 hypothetical protein [Clostridium estertheticum]WAG72709.1 hypothetical protein LL032_16345 [Clostridium estertheticum]